VTGAVVSPMAAAVFAQMLARPLRRRISPGSGIHPENANELREAHAELVRVGEGWRAERISVGSGCVTEIGGGSMQHSEITPKEAAELLNRTDSRVRQLLRDGTLPGRRVGRRWLVQRAAVVAFRDGVGRVAA
jgi:excisionase family DNA binding protein